MDETREALLEALEAINAMMDSPKCHKGILRVRDLVTEALHRMETRTETRKPLWKHDLIPF